MSLESNKIDFEAALSEMKEHIEALDSCIDVDIMNALNAVINEYETHYESDIQSLIDENEELKDKLDN